MSPFLWCFTWLWCLNNQKAWENMFRSSLHFVVAITSQRLQVFSMAALEEVLCWRGKGWRLTASWPESSDIFRLVAPHTSCSSWQTHKQGALYLSVTFCVDESMAHGTDSSPCVWASTGRHKDNHKTTDEMQRINLFLYLTNQGIPEADVAVLENTA